MSKPMLIFLIMGFVASILGAFIHSLCLPAPATADKSNGQAIIMYASTAACFLLFGILQWIGVIP